MKRLLPLLYIVILLFPVVSWADELEDTTNALNQKQVQLQKAKELLEAARKKESELAGGLSPLQASLDTAIAEVELKEAEVNATLADLNHQEELLKSQRTLRNIRLRELYKKMASDKANEFVSLLDSDNLINFAKLSAYQKDVLAEEERLILDLNKAVEEIDKKRAGLQKELDGLAEEKRLAQIKVDNLRYQIQVAQNQQSGASGQMASLAKDIAGLTQKQAEILAAKAAANAVSTTVGTAPPPTGVALPAPPFSGPAYAFASYGYHHRVGMSQYGAKGRAEAGQNFRQILHAYYANVNIGSYPTPATITVNGCHGAGEYGQCWNNQTYNFEEYLKHLYEMPTSWHPEALKAQAVAARTYAVEYLRTHSTICPSQSCHVIKKEINSPAWQKAVDDTTGLVITQNGQPITAWYSSTVGGYTQPSNEAIGWSTYKPWTKVTKDYAGSWPSGGYDKSSPWYHKPWGDRWKSSSCNPYAGTGCNPWMSKEEMTWIFNAAIKYQQTGSASSIAEDLSTFTSPITNFSDIAFSHSDSTGQTTGIIVIGTNQGTINIPGSAVLAAVNLKAPGSIELTSKLFDVIKY